MTVRRQPVDVTTHLTSDDLGQGSLRPTSAHFIRLLSSGFSCIHFVSPISRLAVNHSLSALAVPGSLDSDLGSGALNFAKISLAELDRCGRDILDRKSVV